MAFEMEQASQEPLDRTESVNDDFDSGSDAANDKLDYSTSSDDVNDDSDPGSDALSNDSDPGSDALNKNIDHHIRNILDLYPWMKPYRPSLCYTGEAFLKLDVAAKISVHVRHERFGQKYSNDPKEAWRGNPELPTGSELISDKPPTILNNPVEWKGTNKTEYLGTHYMLCRYEAMSPLRDAMYKVLSAPDLFALDDVLSYTKVKPTGILLSKQGACIRIDYTPTHVVDWKDSKRLTPGTLVALTPRRDAFRTQCIIATVATRSFDGGAEPIFQYVSASNPRFGNPHTRQPRVELFFSDPKDIPFDYSGQEEYIMVEPSTGYFENARYTMTGLQQAADFKAPLDKYVLDNPGKFLSKALRRWIKTDIGHMDYPTVNPAGEEIIIPEGARSFDKSQRVAFNDMVTQNFAIVQGPPGTGKTYTSLMAIQSYVETLKNASPGSRPPPIVIAAQTNHALDQILELCIDRKIGKIVRLGGQSRSDLVTQHTLHNLRSNSKFRKQDSEGLSSWRHICNSIEALVKVYSQDIISAREIYNADLITLSQYQSLLTGYRAALKGGSNHLDDKNVELFNMRCIMLWVSSSSQHGDSVDPSDKPANESRDAPRLLFRNPPDGETDSEGEYQLNKGPEKIAFRHRGTYLSLAPQDTIAPLPSRQVRGDPSKKAKELLAKYSDLYAISKCDRAEIYDYLKAETKICIIDAIRQQLHAYVEVCETLKINRWVNNVEIIESEGIQIIGCTATGLAKYRGMISALMPRIMLIEEASEAREASIAASIFPSLQQLVLVGDHQQLGPQVDDPTLAGEPFNLGVSMFERLVKRGFPSTQLELQRRMVPKIREIVQTFYPNMEDHALVENAEKRPPVPGMLGLTRWWYQHEERHISWMDKSIYNRFEARMIVELIKHLIFNGVEPHQITVLSYYSAQVTHIKSMLQTSGKLREIADAFSVRTVDGFQGEENDIIILSIARSWAAGPGEQNVGFVGDEKRAVVALSRARRGLYVFGNTRILLESTRESRLTWGRVIEAFGADIGTYLPVL